MDSNDTLLNTQLTAFSALVTAWQAILAAATTDSPVDYVKLAAKIRAGTQLLSSEVGLYTTAKNAAAVQNS